MSRTWRHRWLAVLVLVHAALGAAGQDDTASAERSELAYLDGMLHFQLAIGAPDEAAAAGHFNDALASFHTAAQESQAYDLAIYYLGVTYAKLRQYQSALPYLQQAVQRFESYPVRRPGLAAAYQDYAVALYQTGRYADALDVLSKALEHDGSAGTLHFYKGLCHYRLGQHDLSITHLRQALALDPLRSRAEFHIGLNYVSQERFEDALQALDSAASSAPGGSTAAAARDLAGELRGVRRGDGKRWELRLALGSQFDSNVLLQPDDGPALGGAADEDDFRYLVAAGGSFDFWRSPAGHFRGEYDYYRTRHADIEDFDLEAHRPRLELAWSAARNLKLGIDGGLNSYRLGGDDYLRQLYARAFVGLFKRRSGYTEASYKFTDQNYRDVDFDPIRDGELQEIAIEHFVLLDQFRRYLRFGYRYFEDDPDSIAGNDYEVSAHELGVGYRFPLRRRAFVEIDYAYRSEDYRFPISIDPLNRMRDDDLHELRIQYSQPLTSYLTFNLEYLARSNDSSIEDFEYRRQIGSLTLEFAF